MAVAAPASSAGRCASVAQDKTLAYLVVKQDDGLDLATRGLLTASMHSAVRFECFSEGVSLRPGRIRGSPEAEISNQVRARYGVGALEPVANVSMPESEVYPDGDAGPR